MKRIIWTALLFMLAFATALTTGCMEDAQMSTTIEPNDNGEDGFVDGPDTLAQGAEPGESCSSTKDCAWGLRCLILESDRFCVVPCSSDEQCGEDLLCNPVEGSNLGWCQWVLAGGDASEGEVIQPNGNDDQTVGGGDPGTMTDVASYGSLCAGCHGSQGEGGRGPSLIDLEDGLGELRVKIQDTMPPSNPEECVGECANGIARFILENFVTTGGNDNDNSDKPPPEIPDALAPGSQCQCDADCSDVGQNQGACIHGICMTMGTSNCSSSGSTAECSSGSRCWGGTGVPICYPDCNAVSCDGTCDGDGSCVRSNGMDCYRSCGTQCSWAGQPPGSGGDTGNTDPPDMTPPDGNTDLPMGACGTDVETEQFNLMNQDRVSNGLPALACDTRISEVARAHSQDMAQRNYFSHTNLQGQGPSGRVNQAGITGWRSVGENIAYGQRTPQEVQTSWMNSSGHRANILNTGYSHAGVGAYNHNGQWYWTQVFARF